MQLELEKAHIDRPSILKKLNYVRKTAIENYSFNYRSIIYCYYAVKLWLKFQLN